jgi:phosphonate dehydrogenase
VARRLRAFDAEILYLDKRPLPDHLERELSARQVSLTELLARSRYVIPLVHFTPKTRHLIDADALAQLRPGAYLVNTGRGSVVDEWAVADALRSGRLAGYAADVFEMEDWAREDRPRQIPEELRSHPNTLFTPHLGSAVDVVRRDIALRAAQNIIAALRDERPPDAVNHPQTQSRPAAC